MPDRILPDLQACLLCEEVRQELNGNFMLIGILGTITVPGLPVTAYKLCLFTRWCCGSGRFKTKSRITLPDTTSIIAQSEGEFMMESSEEQLTQVTLFGNVQFQQRGIHWIEVFLENELVLRSPILVRVIPSEAKSTP